MCHCPSPFGPLSRLQYHKRIRLHENLGYTENKANTYRIYYSLQRNITYFWLNHPLSLRAQQLHRLEHVNNAFISHFLEDNAQCYEDTRSSDASAKHNIGCIINSSCYFALVLSSLHSFVKLFLVSVYFSLLYSLWFLLVLFFCWYDGPCTFLTTCSNKSFSVITVINTSSLFRCWVA